MSEHSRCKLVLGKNIEKLKKLTIGIIGVGGTGHMATQLLAKYPFKKIMLMDHDVVQESNLDRQLLYTSREIDRPKALLAKQKLNPESEAEIESIINPFNTKHAHLLKKCNLILDCTDNVETRLILNDFCKKNKIPWVYSGAIREIAVVALILPESFCYRCFQDEKVGERCRTAGIMNYAVTTAGSLAASVAIQYLAQGKVETHMLRYNMEHHEFLKIPLKQKRRVRRATASMRS